MFISLQSPSQRYVSICMTLTASLISQLCLCSPRLSQHSHLCLTPEVSPVFLIVQVSAKARWALYPTFQKWGVLAVVQNCHHFHESTHITLGGGEGQWLAYVLKKTLLWCITFSYGVIKNQHFQSTLLGEKGLKKIVLCVRFW